MKYYIIFGLLLAVFALLWFTKDVNAQVKTSKDAVLPYKLVQVVDAEDVQCSIVNDPGTESRCDKIR